MHLLEILHIFLESAGPVCKPSSYIVDLFCMNEYFSSNSIYTYISGNVVLRAGLLLGKIKYYYFYYYGSYLTIDKQ